MSDWDSYQLLDFGAGRKLERFGDVCLDRPSPAAQDQPLRHNELWSKAHARYQRASENRGDWAVDRPSAISWEIATDEFRLELKMTPFGHIGVFPEQYSNWNWITQRVRRHAKTFRLLNLFGYTGASTLAAAAAGAEVVHVDAAKNVVNWARRNAQISGLGDAPVRWIVDDAGRFVQREVKRGKRYQGLVLDPPSFGHGPKNETWKVTTDLLPLLRNCRSLMADDAALVVLTCHSPGFGPAELSAILQESLFGRCSQQVSARQLHLTTADGRRLPSGSLARWPQF